MEETKQPPIYFETNESQSLPEKRGPFLQLVLLTLIYSYCTILVFSPVSHFSRIERAIVQLERDHQFYVIFKGTELEKPLKNIIIDDLGYYYSDIYYEVSVSEGGHVCAFKVNKTDKEKEILRPSYYYKSFFNIFFNLILIFPFIMGIFLERALSLWQIAPFFAALFIFNCAILYLYL